MSWRDKPEETISKFKDVIQEKKHRPEVRMQWWTIVFLAACIGLLLMIVSTFTEPIHRVNDKGADYLIKGNTVPEWKERLILFFYFTFMSNVLALITSSLSVFGIIKVNHTTSKRLKILTATCLTITFIVYWTLLGPSALPKLNAFQILSNVFIHGFTPLLVLCAFIYEARNFKFDKRLKVRRTVRINFWFPVVWIILGTIIYYSLGGHYGDAIYSFLAYGQNPWWMSVIYVVGIGIAFAGFTFLYTVIQNSKSPKKVA